VVDHPPLPPSPISLSLSLLSTYKIWIGRIGYRLPNPLQADLGYYGLSEAILVYELNRTTNLGFPMFSRLLRSDELRLLVRTF